VGLNIKVVMLKLRTSGSMCRGKPRASAARRRDTLPVNVRGIVHECGITRLNVILSTGCTPITGSVVREQD
jgi:hypothetical protein